METDLEKNPDISPASSRAPELADGELPTKYNFSWKNVSYSVGGKEILKNITGGVEKGTLLAVMGPSGCGKTTLLNILSHRLKGPGVTGEQLLYGSTVDSDTLQAVSTYVEQEDHLIGSLTVKETIQFAAKLALGSKISNRERNQRTEDMLRDFGLVSVKDSKIGTPLQRGISGGQKRRVTTASQLITLPKVIFLDEPTSGLDSTSSFEIISCLRNTAQEYGMIVIASIHQPSTSTFLLFDNVLLLTQGQTVYYGPPAQTLSYFSSLGHSPPSMMSPPEFMLELTNVDFMRSEGRVGRLENLVNEWPSSEEAKKVDKLHSENNSEVLATDPMTRGYPRSLLMQTWILLHRMALKSYRDPLAYFVRIAMYFGLAILMGTAWLRLSYAQENISNILNCMFFGSAFMSFMAVAYIPAFLEDRASMVKERANGLYGSTAFLIANTIIGIPFLFLICILFSVITYWLINLRPGASGFFNYVAILFLDLIAAESLVVLISCVFPIFVVSLALTAFANGLWMTVGGFLVTPVVLNVFWKYTFYQFDYQRYAFSALVLNQMVGSVYNCDDACNCMYVTSLADQCLIEGSEAAAQLGYLTKNTLSYGLLIAIAAGMRLLAWLVLSLKRK